MKKIVAVFGPSTCSEHDLLYHDALALGRSLAEAGFSVLKGGYEGVMEAASRGAHDANGSVIGVTADVYYNRGREANAYLTREIKVKSALDQTMELLDLADAYVAIGKSTGTLVEVALAWDYMTKKFLPRKPLILVGDAWKSLLSSITAEFDAQFVHSVSTVKDVTPYLTEFFGPSALLPTLNVING
jgi:uncharacterized protein (TIGR00725 family)